MTLAERVRREAPKMSDGQCPTGQRPTEGQCWTDIVRRVSGVFEDVN